MPDLPDDNKPNDPTDDGTVTDPADETVTETTETEETEDEHQEPETFDRAYVEKLRGESAKYRVRAQRADTLAERLHGELVRATGRLADPSDLAFDEAHLDDETALSVAIDELLKRKPHLASRRPTGDIGQGTGQGQGGMVNLAEMLRNRAS